MQTVIILQTNRDAEDKNDSISIYDVPLTMKFTKRRKLEEEAMYDFRFNFYNCKLNVTMNLNFLL